MHSLILNDGTTYTLQWISAAGGPLTICLAGEHAVRDLAEAFGDPEKTARIIDRGEHTEQTFDGYTDLRVVNASQRDFPIVILVKR